MLMTEALQQCRLPAPQQSQLQQLGACTEGGYPCQGTSTGSPRQAAAAAVLPDLQWQAGSAAGSMACNGSQHKRQHDEPAFGNGDGHKKQEQLPQHQAKVITPVGASCCPGGMNGGSRGGCAGFGGGGEAQGQPWECAAVLLTGPSFRPKKLQWVDCDKHKSC
jgi:hypothetical protein